MDEFEKWFNEDVFKEDDEYKNMVEGNVFIEVKVVKDAWQESARQHISKWFEKGRQSVKRTNKSGCTCIIDDNDKIISACGAHAEWKEATNP